MPNPLPIYRDENGVSQEHAQEAVKTHRRFMKEDGPCKYAGRRDYVECISCRATVREAQTDCTLSTLKTRPNYEDFE